MKPRVWLGIPTFRSVPSRTFFSHVQLALWMLSEDLLAGFSAPADLPVAMARNRIGVDAMAASQDGCTHLLFVDDDICIPQGALRRLLSHGKPIVSGCYTDTEGQLVAYSNLSPLEHVGQPLIESGPIPVKAAGLGCCLIDLAVLTELDERNEHRQTWFQTPFVGREYVGEDVFFFGQCLLAGVPVYLDPLVKCTHVKPSFLAVKEPTP